MIVCPRCEVEGSDDSIFCRRCGSRLDLPIEAPETTAGLAVGEKEAADAELPDYGAIVGTVLQIRSDGDREGEIVAVDGDVLTIGRSPQTDLFLDDVTVSRHHARIVIESEGYLIEDLNSLNGTYVNRKRIERHQLFDGDELQIGKFKLAFLQEKSED
jgi:hypothetical protein